MMEELPKYVRVLAIAPSTRGFGFAVLEGEDLIDWGVKTVSGDKNARCLSKAESLITRYKPDVLVLEDFLHTKRGPRIRLLIQRIIDVAPNYSVGVELFSREQVYGAFFADGKGTKEALAEILAKRFPDELGPRLPILPPRLTTKLAMSSARRLLHFHSIYRIY